MASWKKVLEFSSEIDETNASFCKERNGAGRIITTSSTQQRNDSITQKYFKTVHYAPISNEY